MFRNPFGFTSRAGTVVMGAALAAISITPLFPAVSAASRTTIVPAPFAPTLRLAPSLAPMVAKVKKVAKSPLARLESPFSGLASWYGSVLHGHHSADGGIFDEHEMTAAHNSLPFGTRVRVVDVTTGRSVIVKITDRGILSPGRVIDLSSSAAENLGILSQGVARVRLEVLKGEAAVESAQPQ